LSRAGRHPTVGGVLHRTYALLRLSRNPTTALAGYRYAKNLPTPAPAIPHVSAKGTLEKYFDAHREGPGLWKWRHYFDIYERHLGKFVGRNAHVVEVGIFSGGSLGMWTAYFGNRCHIYGVDIEDACRVYERDRVRIFIGDQADPLFWQNFCHAVPTVDVLIDDGGHTADQQITTLQAMLPHIRPGGVYICEDSLGAFHRFHAFVDGLCRPLHSLGETSTNATPASILHRHVSSVHRYPLLTVIEKPDLPLRDFECPRHGTEWQPFL
jgi:hypothetical protein